MAAFAVGEHELPRVRLAPGVVKLEQIARDRLEELGRAISLRLRGREPMV
ncbi:MAG: hypothetical protein WKF41_13290 [Gaiellaceae bacterium]